jgi:hypothetical protein
VRKRNQETKTALTHQRIAPAGTPKSPVEGVKEKPGVGGGQPDIGGEVGENGG